MKFHQAMQFSRYLIGIDLGTTNSAVAYVDTQEPITGDAPPIHVFDIPQLIAEGEVGVVPTLPSFLYLANEQDAPGSLRLPWEERPDAVVGVFARACSRTAGHIGQVLALPRRG
jgi:molecular chaperone DnaK (HSP70)